jgi:hypothetical protein
MMMGERLEHLTKGTRFSISVSNAVSAVSFDNGGGIQHKLRTCYNLTLNRDRSRCRAKLSATMLPLNLKIGHAPCPQNTGAILNVTHIRK